MEHACIVSAVTIAGRGCAVPDTSLEDALRALHRASASLNTDFELVVINNGASSGALAALRALAAELPNMLSTPYKSRSTT